MHIIDPICYERKCKHYQGVLEWEPGKIDSKFSYVCKAFPEAIPWPILDEKDPHTTPYPGDHGIQYEPVKEET